MPYAMRAFDVPAMQPSRTRGRPVETRAQMQRNPFLVRFGADGENDQRPLLSGELQTGLKNLTSKQLDWAAKNQPRSGAVTVSVRGYQYWC